MTSNDLVIRTERSVIEVVLKNESDISSLRKEFEDFRAETRQEFKNVRQEISDFKREHNEQYIILTSNQQILSNKIDSLKDSLALMQNIFTWGFAAVAIGVAIAPIVKSCFDSRKDKSLSEEVSRQVDSKVRELLASQKRSD